MGSGSEDGSQFPLRFFQLLFSEALKKDGREVEVRCIPRNKKKPVVRRFYQTLSALKTAWSDLIDLNDERYEVLFGVIPRDAGNGNELTGPVTLHCLFVDLDVGPEKPCKNINEALRRLKKFKLKPTAIVQSGNGLHVYFLLRKPVRVDSGEVKRLLQELARSLGGDLQSAEPARLLRAPNTINWKDVKKPKPCKVLSLKPKRRYRLSKIVGPRRFPRLPQQPRNTGEDYLAFYRRHVKNLEMRSDEEAMGLCPFHEDHNPSWSLRVMDGVWHCFGCGRSGNALSFCLMGEIEPDHCPQKDRLQDHSALAVEAGGYVAWKRRRNHWEKRRISKFILEWDEENRVSDKIRLEDRVFHGQLVLASGERVPIRISNKELCSNSSFYERLVLEAGGKISLSENDVSNIRRASLLFSKPQYLQSLMDFGFQNDTTFLSKTVVITADAIKPATEDQVDLGRVEHARNLDMKKISRDEARDLLEHIRDHLLDLQPHTITYAMLGFHGGAPLMYFMEDQTRYALWLVGQSGSGKSFIAKLFQSFCGAFMAEGRVVSWSSTPNSLQHIGYFFKDCLYLVDDYKPVMTGNPAHVVRFLQNYADFYGRSRLTSEIKSRQDYFVRGSLLTTGEDTPAGHASLIARSLIVSVPKRQHDTRRGKLCLANCKNYPGVTAWYIHYLLGLPNLREKINASFHQYHEFFLEDIAQEDNSVRIARNLALNYVGFFFFTEFLQKMRVSFPIREMRSEHKANLLELRDRMLYLIHQENPGKILLQVLGEAMGSGRARINGMEVDDTSQNTPIVGFVFPRRDSCVFIFPREAMAFVREQEKRAGRDFSWTPNAVSKALRALGALVKGQVGKDFGTRMKFKGRTHRTWMMPVSAFGWQDTQVKFKKGNGWFQTVT